MIYLLAVKEELSCVSAEYEDTLENIENMEDEEGSLEFYRDEVSNEVSDQTPIKQEDEEDTSVFSVWKRLKKFMQTQMSNQSVWEEFIEKILESNNLDDFNKNIENSKVINPDLHKLFELLDKFGINSFGELTEVYRLENTKTWIIGFAFILGSIAAFEIKKMIIYLLCCALVYIFIINPSAHSCQQISSFSELKNLFIKASQTVNHFKIYFSAL